MLRRILPYIMTRLLQDLNDAQREAVTSTEGPLLVIAGAGSGKTRVLTRRLTHILMQRLAEPYQILAVTFTNKAAGEMKERVATQLGGSIPSMNVSTFHSFCARLLRREAETIGFDSSFTIFDQTDALTLVKNCIGELGVSTTQFAPKGQLSKISGAKNKMISDADFASRASGYFEETTAKIYVLYQRRLRECGAMDFDDLLFNTVVLLRDHEQVGQSYRERFRYVLVDEYQDTNHVQYLLLRHIVGDHNNICVVGDEDQSIYGWRGADISNILNFEKDFPGAKTIKLEQNYRSTAVILRAAASVIRNNEARKEKKLWCESEGGDKIKLYLVDSADDEAVRIVDAINALQSEARLKDMAILYRTNAQSRSFEEKLRRANLPYQIVGGLSFYQRKEIKDVMAYLKLLANPKDDVSFGRIVNYPKRGVGQKSVQQIKDAARTAGVSAYEGLLQGLANADLGARASRLIKFTEMIEKFRAKINEVPVDLLASDLVDELDLLEDLRSEDKIIGQTKVENIEALIEGMAEFARGNGEATLDNYLAEITLFTDLDKYSDTENKLTMMTLHTAKGLEYDNVFLVGLEEGLFPLERAIHEPMELEEERRLFYVGATRARKKLAISSASSRFRFGEVVSIPSRFIKEIPKELMEIVDERHARRYVPEKSKQPSLFPNRGKPSRQPAAQQGVHYEYEGQEALQPGRMVQHPTFGRGKIVKAEGFGESLRLQIVFAGIGQKTIMAKYAKLKPIG